MAQITEQNLIAELIDPSRFSNVERRGTNEGAPLPPITRSNAALILHDIQNDFIKESLAKPEMQAVVKRTKILIDLAHSLQMPVICTRVETDPLWVFRANALLIFTVQARSVSRGPPAGHHRRHQAQKRRFHRHKSQVQRVLSSQVERSPPSLKGSGS